jgi:hypothetical protein
MPGPPLGGQPNLRPLDLVKGRAANVVTAYGDELFVTIETLGGQTKAAVGYPYRPGSPLANVNDECLVALDEGRNAWVVAWEA